jgi:hypothetical protein
MNEREPEGPRTYLPYTVFSRIGTVHPVSNTATVGLLTAHRPNARKNADRPEMIYMMALPLIQILMP